MTLLEDRNQPLLNKGLNAEKDGDLTNAVHYYLEALDLAKQSNEPQLSLLALSYIIHLYRVWGKFAEAINYSQRALQICEQLRDQSKKKEILLGWGLIYRKMRKFEEALDCYREVLRFNEVEGNLLEKGTTLKRIGAVYRDQGKFAEAIDCYQQALRLYEALGNSLEKKTCLKSIEQVYRIWEDFAERDGAYRRSLDEYRHPLPKHREFSKWPPGLIKLRNVTWRNLPFILLFSFLFLDFYGAVIGNFVIVKIGTIMVISLALFIYFIVLLMPSSFKNPPIFQIQIRAQLRRFFRNPPFSYFSTGGFILIIDVSWFVVLLLIFCTENFGPFCWGMTVIFLIFVFCGLGLMGVGLVLTIRKNSLAKKNTLVNKRKSIELILQAVFWNNWSPVQIAEINDEYVEQDFAYKSLLLEEVIHWKQMFQRAKNEGWKHADLRRRIMKYIKKGYNIDTIEEQLKLIGSFGN